MKKFACVHTDAILCIECGGCGKPVSTPRTYAIGKENLKKLGKNAMDPDERKNYIKYL